MSDLESHWLAERLAYRSLSRDTVRGQKVRDDFQFLESDPEAEGHRKPKDATPFTRECRKVLRKLSRSNDLSQSRKDLYRELVVGSASDPLVKRLSWSLEEIRSQWNWAPGSGFLNDFEFPLTWRLAQNALSLTDWEFKAGSADKPDCLRCNSGQEETALHAVNYCEQVRSFCSHVGEWTARIDPCCSTLVTPWTMLTLCIKVRSVWCFSRS